MVEALPQNPTPPDDQLPNYTFWSRPIEQPKANLSGEILGKGIGHAIGAGSELGVKAYEDVISDDVWKRAKPLTDNFVVNMIGANRKFDPDYGGSTADNLFGAPSGQQPQQVAALPGQVDKWINARQNGKVSPSQLDMQVYSLSSELREKYPGFRDYVDEQISRVTGVHPANQLVRGLISDYNANVTAQQGKIDAIENKAIQFMGYGNVRDAVAQYNRAGKTPEARMNLENAVFDAAYEKGRTERADLDYKNAHARNENYAETAKYGFDDIAGTKVANNLKTLAFPFRGGTYTLDQWNKGIADGTITAPTSVEAQQIGIWFDQRKNEMRAALLQEAYKPRDNGSGQALPPYSTYLGNVNEAVEKALAPWDTQKKIFTGDNPTLAGLSGVLIKAKQADLRGTLSGTSLGDMLDRVAVMTEELGKNNPANATLFGSVLAGQSAEIQTWIMNGTAKVLNPPTEGVGQTTLSDIVNDARSKFFNVPGKPQVWQDAGAFASIAKRSWSFLNSVVTAKSMDRDVRQRAIEAISNPNNKDVIDNFKSDVFTPEGKLRPGAESLYGAAYNTDVVKGVFKYGTPEQKQNFTNNAEIQAGKLVRNDLVTLNQTATKIPLVYDPDLHTFHVEDAPGIIRNTFNAPPAGGSVMSGSTFARMREAQAKSEELRGADQVAHNINKVMFALQNVYQETGQDVNAQLLRFLHDSGADPEIIKTFSDAVINSKKKTARDDTGPQ